MGCAGQDSTAAAFADVDGVYDLDLLVNSLGGGTRLFRNDTGLYSLGSQKKQGLVPMRHVHDAADMKMTVIWIAWQFHPTTIKDSPNTDTDRMVNNRPWWPP